VKRRLKLPDHRAFHIAAPYLAGLAAVALSTAVGTAFSDIVFAAWMILMVLAIILWLLLVLRACRDIGLLAFTTVPSAALAILAGSMLPALLGACVFTNRCI
jgi:prepilin signal peptidase PulO-like enzyme (type II secretory pathway)